MIDARTEAFAFATLADFTSLIHSYLIFSHYGPQSCILALWAYVHWVPIYILIDFRVWY